MTYSETLEISKQLIGNTTNVLDKGEVTLVDVLPHPSTGITCDEAIVSAARVSFLQESKGEERDAKLIDYLMRNHHTSPFEMVRIKFATNLPLLVLWQLVRHRTFSFMSINSESGRYVEFDEGSFYVPKELRLQSKNNKQGSDGVMDRQEANHFLVELNQAYEHGYDLYKRMIDAGIAREEARLALNGFGVYYKWIVLVDLNNLMHFLKLRMDSNAQYEIRETANAMYGFVKQLAPITMSAFDHYTLGIE